MEKIILVGHGSRKKDANNIEPIGRVLHGIVHPGCTGNCIKVAYLQFAHPEISHIIKESVDEGADTIIVHPFFLSSGMHVTHDIPEIVQDAEKTYPDIKFIYTEPLGFHEKLAQIVADRIYTAKGMTPQDIEKRSFEIISEEMDFTGAPHDEVPVIKRVIHATADPEFRASLCFRPGAVAAGIEAIRSGRDILTDVEMVRTGINKKLLEKWGGKVICRIEAAKEARIAKRETRNVEDMQRYGGEADSQWRLQATRAERGIETALTDTNNIGIIAVGNAPTALLKVMELFDKKGVADPAPLVIGVPVGFVRAAESKALLAAQNFPFITNTGRKGGTPVAVAIVNALLKMADET